jgi:hypothetical protein
MIGVFPHMRTERIGWRNNDLPSEVNQCQSIAGDAGSFAQGVSLVGRYAQEAPAAASLSPIMSRVWHCRSRASRPAQPLGTALRVRRDLHD